MKKTRRDRRTNGTKNRKKNGTPEFKGVIELDVRDSKADWTPYQLKKVPEGAPNVLIVLYDDTGHAAWSPFGGRIEMPTLQKLADNGLTDAQVGRLIDYLEKSDQIENTLIFYCADNGASGECSPNGSVNENKFFNGYPDELAESLTHLDTLGSHYPTGWAVAFSTLFQMFKRYSERLFARMAEVYAGLSEYRDAQVGRIIDYLERSDQLENPLIFYCADNSALGEGSLSGSVNENKFFNGYPDELAENFVLPLDDRSAPELFTSERPRAEPPRTRYAYYPNTAPVPEGVAVNLRGRSCKIIAHVDLTAQASGVIFAHGLRFGGHSMFIKDRKLCYVYNALGIKPEQMLCSQELPTGKHAIGMEFVREQAGEHGESLGTARLYVDDEVVAEAPMRTQAGFFTLSGDELCIGYDSGDSVSQEYQNPGTFTGGTVLGVGFDMSEEVYLDLEREAEAVAAPARD